MTQHDEKELRAQMPRVQAQQDDFPNNPFDPDNKYGCPHCKLPMGFHLPRCILHPANVEARSRQIWDAQLAADRV